MNQPLRQPQTDRRRRAAASTWCRSSGRGSAGPAAAGGSCTGSRSSGRWRRTPARPSGCRTGSGRGARLGILIKGGESLERIGRLIGGSVGLGWSLLMRGHELVLRVGADPRRVAEVVRATRRARQPIAATIRSGCHSHDRRGPHAPAGRGAKRWRAGASGSPPASVSPRVLSLRSPGLVSAPSPTAPPSAHPHALSSCEQAA